ncbi:MAG: hypothetical protein A2Y23_05385 [Clostridiales bacterium GWB2_37_7]|nr:MAG: hypothetical protein A2Y23_05385 [Clostridiales bacterium GWB2_37_7]
MMKLVANRLILAVLCIIIGVAPMVAFINTLESGKQMLKNGLGNEATVLLNIDLEGSSALYEDFEKLSEQMPEIRTIMPISINSSILSSYKEQSTVRLKAVNSSFLKYAGLEMTRGIFLTEGHLDDNLNVIVIDELTADQLFGTTAVVGRTIETSIEDMEFEATIIGVSKRLDLSEKQLNNEQGIAYIPITMLDNNLTFYKLQKTLVLLENIKIDEAKAKIRYFFKNNGLKIEEVNIKQINQVELLEAFTDKYKGLLIAMALVWLTVAIVGLGNIMLLDIEKSKQYYGLLKFYGSSVRRIRSLVYLKAYTISLASGICSLILGLGISFIVCYILNIPLYISIYSIALGFLLPVLVCISASIYPAYAASNIDVNNTIWQVDYNFDVNK